MIPRSILISGGTSGIGRALAMRFRAAGDRVVVIGRSQNALRELRDLGIDTVEGDVTSAITRANALEKAANGAGVDILVNNAGVQRYPNFTAAVDSAAIDREIGINLVAPILFSAEAVRFLRKSADPVIVLVSSALAIAPKQSAPVYCATKAGLRSFAKALGYQLQTTRIRVFTVFPPTVATPMTSGRNSGAMTADQAARGIINGITSGRSELFLGKAWLLPILSRAFPRFTDRMMRYADVRS